MNLMNEPGLFRCYGSIHHNSNLLKDEKMNSEHLIGARNPKAQLSKIQQVQFWLKKIVFTGP